MYKTKMYKTIYKTKMYKTQLYSLGVTTVLALALLNCSLAIAAPILENYALENSAETIANGQKLAFDTLKGNCLACHQIEGGESPGDIGPPLINMKIRYPDLAKLRAQIWDATVMNPETSMPPFGRHNILTDQEIDQIVAFIWTK
jgi:sulfur-oxidizing protein SoxX